MLGGGFISISYTIRRTILHLGLCCLSVSLLVACAESPVSKSAPEVMLFIGDGMGLEQRKAATWLGYGEFGSLQMDSLEVTGSLSTASYNSAITDSAAGATAFSTGHKTSNGVVAKDHLGNNLETILEYAQSMSLATGIVTTTEIYHATPAAFAAHAANRGAYESIAYQMINSGVDLMLGGGESYLLPLGTIGVHGVEGKRTDGLNLIESAGSLGYDVLLTNADLASYSPSVFSSKVLGIFGSGGMTEPYTPSLKDMTQFALDYLSLDPNGFILIVEGGQIDWRGHANTALSNMENTLWLDDAVLEGKEYQVYNPDALLIVTADHETGGMEAVTDSTGHIAEEGPFYMPDNTAFYVNWSTTGHTGVDVPVTAIGPHSDSLNGLHENTEVYFAIKSYLDQFILDN